MNSIGKKKRLKKTNFERVRNYWVDKKGTIYVSIPKCYCNLLNLEHKGKFKFSLAEGNRIILEKV